MISCDDAKRQLSAFIEGTLAPADSTLVRDHLASCQSCRQVATQMEFLMDRMKTVSPVFVSSDFDQRLRERIVYLDDSSASSVRWRSSWSYGLSGAALLVAVYLFISVQLTETPVQMNTNTAPAAQTKQNITQPQQKEQFVTSSKTENDNSALSDSSMKRADDVEKREINLIDK